MLRFRPQALVIAVDGLFEMLRFKTAAQKSLYAADLLKPQHIVLLYAAVLGGPQHIAHIYIFLLFSFNINK